MRPSPAALLAGLLLAACGRPTRPAGHGPRAPARAPLDWPEIGRLQRANDYFTLRDRLPSYGPGAATAPARYARAVVQHAFNDPAASAATAAALLAGGRLTDSLAAQLRLLQVASHLRLGTYAAGLAAADTLLADTARLTAAERSDVRNTRRIFRALAAVPPQSVVVRGPFVARLAAGRVPVQVNDSARHYVFDTGANLSTIMRSEARALGLRLYPANLGIGTSTDRRVTADLAVADRLTIGRAEFRHVVFLVVDDALLSFADGFRIPGIVGFPVIAALGEVQLGRDSTLAVLSPAPRRAAANLALDGLTPVTRVRWADGADLAGAPAGAALVCRLDTGANRTQFYTPFYRRFQARLDTTTALVRRKTGGVGGYREFPTRVLRPARLAAGDTLVRLDSADVLTRSIAQDPTADALECNLGHDVLDAFPRYVLNFRDMAFLLR